MENKYRGGVIKKLHSTAQAFTNTWTDLGNEIDMKGYNALVAFIDITIGTSTASSIRAMGRWESGGTNYNMPLEIETATKVTVKAEYLEFLTVDQNVMVGFQTDNRIPYVQLQIKDAAGGSGVITQTVITKREGYDYR